MESSVARKLDRDDGGGGMMRFAKVTSWGGADFLIQGLEVDW